MTAKTNTERQREYRADMRSKGFVLRHHWVNDEDWEKVSEFLAKVMKKRKRLLKKEATK